MELFIQIKNGKPFEHPILGENFRQVFPDVDLNNLPNWVARFIRKEKRPTQLFEVYEGVTYEWDGDCVVDLHHFRPMTDQEKEKLFTDAETEYKQFLNQEFASAQQEILSATETNKLHWQNYMNAISAWSLLDVENPNLPVRPAFNDQGQYLEPISIGVTRV